MRVQSSLNEEVKKKTNHLIGVRVGYLIFFGHLKGTSKTKIPYISVFYRDNLSGGKWYYELDISYFVLRNEYTSVAISTTAHHLPMTLNVLYPLSVMGWLKLSPKMGVGYMPAYITSSNSLNGSRFSSFFIAKPGLELDINLSKRFSLHLENTFLFSWEIKDLDFTIFYIPNFGMSYKF